MNIREVLNEAVAIGQAVYKAGEEHLKLPETETEKAQATTNLEMLNNSFGSFFKDLAAQTSRIDAGSEFELEEQVGYANVATQIFTFYGKPYKLSLLKIGAGSDDVVFSLEAGGCYGKKSEYRFYDDLKFSRSAEDMQAFITDNFGIQIALEFPFQENKPIALSR